MIRCPYEHRNAAYLLRRRPAPELLPRGEDQRRQPVGGHPVGPPRRGAFRRPTGRSLEAAVRLDARGPGLLRGVPRGAGAVRFGRGPGALAADGDRRAGAGGGDLFGRPARHEPLHAGLHAAISQGQGAAGVSAAEQGLRRRAERRGRSGHHLLSGGVARPERDPACGPSGWWWFARPATRWPGTRP